MYCTVELYIGMKILKSHPVPLLTYVAKYFLLLAILILHFMLRKSSSSSRTVISCLNVKFTTADLKGLCHEIRSSSFSHFLNPYSYAKVKVQSVWFRFCKDICTKNCTCMDTATHRGVTAMHTGTKKKFIERKTCC